MTRCASCHADDELLFTCTHCDGQFCARHQFPHHACSRFTHREDADQKAGDATDSAGDRAVVGATGGSAGGDATDGPTRADATTERSTSIDGDRTTVPGPRVEVARDAARATRPDREGPAPAPPGRGMPWERSDASVAEWIREQTYPSYLAKVGGLSLVLTTAYYGGLVVTLYGYV